MTKYGVCFRCKNRLTDANARPSIVLRRTGLCRICSNKYYKEHSNHPSKNVQRPGKTHKFVCGCEGLLPNKGESNKLAIFTATGFVCRVTRILNSSKHNAKRRGYKAISKNIDHLVIREMMKSNRCETCGEPLKWAFSRGETPHLHHDHKTGEILGFSHSICNLGFVQMRIMALREENETLRLILQQKRPDRKASP